MFFWLQGIKTIGSETTLTRLLFGLDSGGNPRSNNPNVNRFEFAALLLGALKKLWGNPDRAKHVSALFPLPGHSKDFFEVLRLGSESPARPTRELPS